MRSHHYNSDFIQNEAEWQPPLTHVPSAVLTGEET